MTREVTPRRMKRCERVTSKFSQRIVVGGGAGFTFKRWPSNCRRGCWHSCLQTMRECTSQQAASSGV